MNFSQDRQAILIFPSYETAVLSFDQLLISGFSPTKVSIVGTGLVCIHKISDNSQLEAQTNQPPTRVFIRSGNGFTVGWFIGNVLGGVTGILLGLSVSGLPGVDGVMLLSKIIFTLSSGFFCTVSGGILGAFIDFRVNQEQSKEYSRRLAQGDYLIVVKGKTDEINRAKQLLSSFLQK